MKLYQPHTIRGLQIFETVARHGSISKAAEELCVTQSAVSHQLRKLSEQLGERLVVKSGRGILLTATGQRLALRLQVAFHQIESSVTEVVGTGRDTLRLAVCSSFAPGWLIGRMGRFVSSHANVDLQLRMYAKDPELTDQVADAFVTTLPKEAGFWSMRIKRELLIAVHAAGRKPPPAMPLITTSLEPGNLGSDWRHFCQRTRRPLSELHDGQWLQVSHYILALEMARCGLGAALVPDFLVEAEIAAGELMQIGSTAIPTDEDYYLCMKEARRHERALSALASWFKSEIAGPLPSARATADSAMSGPR